MSDEAWHGDAAHDDRIALGAKDRERQCSSGDAFEADTRAVEREGKRDDRASIHNAANPTATSDVEATFVQIG